MCTGGYELASLETKQIYDCLNGRTLLRQYGIVTVHAGEDEYLLIYFRDGIILAFTSK